MVKISKSQNNEQRIQAYVLKRAVKVLAREYLCMRACFVRPSIQVLRSRKILTDWINRNSEKFSKIRIRLVESFVTDDNNDVEAMEN